LSTVTQQLNLDYLHHVKIMNLKFTTLEATSLTLYCAGQARFPQPNSGLASLATLSVSADGFAFEARVAFKNISL